MIKKILIYLALLSSLHADSLKIISYNVLYGFNHGKSIEVASQWLKEQEADFVALQEVKGFSADKFAELAKTWGHDYSYFYNRKPGMPLAFSSRFPITEVEELHQGVKRGFLKLKCHGYSFMVVHMTSQRLTAREQELTYMSSQIKDLLKKDEGLIVLGDFNSFSHLDLDRLSELDDLLKEMRQNPKKKANLNKGHFDVSIMSSFDELGLVDLCHEKLFGKEAIKGSFPSTLLEKIPNREVQEKHLRRIDFVLSDQKTAKKLLKADIPKGGALETISDHYPVIIEITDN
ncbi:endonuclease/exonuclease/phosphatase family protein [Lentisphaera marina]|uniref:endonuclease/exonuclease/phosphatase family protein n=1 Tax=Lentisphaera marina TaxID=1111041 RepID=UPI00236663FF|nr:endonuclease/exonuclease/phosphatase family protein [Lentisphaera marina]MDD7985454.1 endonuclease/exonuclease/phosphatase family protein [Lentisphaera marina]